MRVAIVLLLALLTLALAGCNTSQPEPDTSTMIGREQWRQQHVYRSHVERTDHPQADKLRKHIEEIQGEQERNPEPPPQPKNEYQVIEFVSHTETVTHGTYPSRDAARDLRQQLRQNNPAGHYVISQKQNY